MAVALCLRTLLFWQPSNKVEFFCIDLISTEKTPLMDPHGPWQVHQSLYTRWSLHQHSTQPRVSVVVIVAATYHNSYKIHVVLYKYEMTHHRPTNQE